MPPRRILILGGTGEARDLAQALLAAGHSIVTSLAGVTEKPVLPAGQVRIGGFSGAGGLAAYISAENIELVIDATHPFAAQMSRQASETCRPAGVPILRLERPPWEARSDDRWTTVASIAEAANAVPAGARVLLTIGRKEAALFFARGDISGIARMIEPPADQQPAHWCVLRERPPFSVAAEVELMTTHGITHLVTKNAGGDATASKLEAARVRGIPVVMVSRPVKPDVPVFTSTDAVLRAVERVLSP